MCCTKAPVDHGLWQLSCTAGSEYSDNPNSDYRTKPGDDDPPAELIGKSTTVCNGSGEPGILKALEEATDDLNRKFDSFTDKCVGTAYTRVTAPAACRGTTLNVDLSNKDVVLRTATMLGEAICCRTIVKDPYAIGD